MALLKLTFVFFFMAVCTLAHDLPPEYMEIAKALHDKCQAETGVTEQHIQDANNGKFADDNVLKCYMKCMMVKSTIMTEDGKLNTETLLSMIPEDHKDALTSTVQKCQSLVGSDPCETAFLLHKCYYENSPEYYLLI